MITQIGKYKLNKTETKFVNDTLGYAHYGSVDEMPTVEVANRFTGVGHILPILANAIFDWINNWQDEYDRGGVFSPKKGMSIKEFDMARGLFRKVWPEEYMSLLD